MSKCDKLKRETRDVDYGLGPIPVSFYDADKVDAAIAELKDKIQMHDFFWEGCGFDKLGFKNAINVRDYCDKLKKENESLKAENESLKHSVATLDTDIAMLKRWRKVSEEKPEKRQFVLARFADRLAGHYPIDVIQWDVSYSRNHDGVQVTHWMPLPSAPKEDK